MYILNGAEKTIITDAWYHQNFKKCQCDDVKFNCMINNIINNIIKNKSVQISRDIQTSFFFPILFSFFKN